MKVVNRESLNKTARYLRLLVYGEPGTGKTWFGASAAIDDLTAPVLFIEYRAQIGSIGINPEFVQAMDEGRLLIVTLESYKELNHIHQWFEKGRGSSKGLDDLMKSYGHPDDLMPKTLVIDSLTELQRSEVLRRAGNNEDKFTVDVERPQIQDWGSLLNQFTLLAHQFYNFDVHMVFGGLEDVDYGDSQVGETAPITGYRLAMQGQAKRQFPAYAMTMLRLDRAPASSNAYNLGYTYQPKSKTKDQTGTLPAKIPNPTIPMLVKLLNKRVAL